MLIVEAVTTIRTFAHLHAICYYNSNRKISIWSIVIVYFYYHHNRFTQQISNVYGFCSLNICCRSNSVWTSREIFWQHRSHPVIFILLQLCFTSSAVIHHNFLCPHTAHILHNRVVLNQILIIMIR